jgi:hypothetical protein
VLLDDLGQMRRNVDGDVDLAVLEGGHADGVVGNRLEDDGLDVGGAPPVIGDGLHHDLLVLGPAHELVGPGADRIPGDRRGVLARVLLGRVHGRAPEGQVGDEHRPRLLGVHAYRVLVHDLDPIDEAEGRRAPELVGGIGQPLEAELDRLRVKVLPVVELHALAELDLPGGRRHQLGKLGGQPRHQLQALVPLDEQGEHLSPHVGGGLLRLIHHVERGRVHTLGDDDLAHRGREGRGGK